MSKSDKLWIIGSIFAPFLAWHVYGFHAFGAAIAGAGIGYGLYYWNDKIRWHRAGMTMEEVEVLRSRFTDVKQGRADEARATLRRVESKKSG